MKKRNIMKTLFAGTMTLGMALSISPAFAVDDNIAYGTPDDPVQLWLTKKLDIANGVTFNEQNFNFDFKFISFSGGEPSQTDLDTMLDTTLAVSSNNSEKMKSKNVLDGVTFDAAGKYTFEVDETNEDNLADGFGLDCSEAKYRADIYVKNKENSTDTYVYAVAVNKVLNDDGTDADGKVNPNPGSGNEEEGLIFVNKYTKQAGNNDGTGYLGMTLSKTVTGDYGDKTRDFEFTINLTKASTETDDHRNFDTYIVKGDSQEAAQQLSYGENKISLSHGETLKIYGLPAGTTYQIVETQVNNYSTSIDVNKDGTADIQGVNTNEKIIGDDTSYVDYTNDYNDEDVATPTGIIINNLPFVLMVVVAGSGLALYVVSKRRSHQ